MFSTNTYIERRNKLKSSINKGIAVFLSNPESPMNYASNQFPYRQDSNFLYFFGYNEPHLAAIIDFESCEEVLFGDDIEISDIIWMGELESVVDKGKNVGVLKTKAFKSLSESLIEAKKKDRTIHYLPPYQAENTLFISQTLGIPYSELKAQSSLELIKGIAKLRAIKESQEIDEILDSLNIAYEMHTTAMSLARNGIKEQYIVGIMDSIPLKYGGLTSFTSILSQNGQILHNHNHGETLKNGRLLLVDAGAENKNHYASDLTRTTPVGGRFSEKQKDVYNVVLNANLASIKHIKAGIPYQQIHLKASLTIADGLKNLGLLKGNAEDIVANGAHALFFPHGIGHLMGLDVHDMEDLGENIIGYDQQTKRSEQFGMAYLRYGKELQVGNLVTVEPGIYFIPALIDLWIKENKFTEFINYSKVNEYRDFGGIRIEDDVLVRDTDGIVLGKPVPKTVAEIERVMSE